LAQTFSKVKGSYQQRINSRKPRDQSRSRKRVYKMVFSPISSKVEYEMLVGKLVDPVARDVPQRS